MEVPVVELTPEEQRYAAMRAFACSMKKSVKRLACQVNVMEKIDEEVKSKKNFKQLTVEKILKGSGLAGQPVVYKDQAGYVDINCIRIGQTEMGFDSLEAGDVLLSTHLLTLYELSVCINAPDIGRNLDSCEVCNQEGTVLLCDGCPAAAHQSCAEMSDADANRNYLFCGACRKDLTDMYKMSFYKDGSLRLPPGVQEKTANILISQVFNGEKSESARDAAEVDLVLRIRPASQGLGRSFCALESPVNSKNSGEIEIQDIVLKGEALVQEMPASNEGPTEPQPYQPSQYAGGYTSLLVQGVGETLTRTMLVDDGAVGSNVHIDPLSWAVGDVEGRVVVCCDLHLTRTPPVAYHDRTEPYVNIDDSPTWSLPSEWFERHYRELEEEGKKSQYPNKLNLVIKVHKQNRQGLAVAAIIPNVDVVKNRTVDGVKRRWALKGESLHKVLSSIIIKANGDSVPVRWVPRYHAIDKQVLVVLIEVAEEDTRPLQQRQDEAAVVRHRLQMASFNMDPSQPLNIVKAPTGTSAPLAQAAAGVLSARPSPKAPTTHKSPVYQVGEPADLTGRSGKAPKSSHQAKPETSGKKAGLKPALKAPGQPAADSQTPGQPVASGKTPGQPVASGKTPGQPVTSRKKPGQQEKRPRGSVKMPGQHQSEAPSEAEAAPDSATVTLFLMNTGPATDDSLSDGRKRARTEGVISGGVVRPQAPTSLALVKEEALALHQTDAGPAPHTQSVKLFAVLGLGLALTQNEGSLLDIQPQLKLLKDTVSEVTNDDASFESLPEDLQLRVYKLKTKIESCLHSETFPDGMQEAFQQLQHHLMTCLFH